MGVCVPNFRSVTFFVWPGDVTHINTKINKYTHIQVKLEISPTGCSLHVDFDFKITFYKKFRYMFSDPKINFEGRV